MSENIDKTLSKYEKEILDQVYGLCPYCNQPKTDRKWCQNCNSKQFQQEFTKWTSENNLIDKFIQDAQLKARNRREVIEWIPYNRLRNIQYLAQGGFSTVYKAIWLDGCIGNWNYEKNQWNRYYSALENKNYMNTEIKFPHEEYENHGVYVVLKSFKNSSNISEDFLNEWKNHLNFIYSAKNDRSCSVQIYGITRDPETSNYIIVLKEVKLGSLRSNLMLKKYNPNDKYNNLFHIAQSLLALHKCNLVHGDFHSGNLLLGSHHSAYISDLGLSKPVDKPTKSNEIYGVIPYMAPEVLRGKPYTKAADIYSFGIIMWEMTSGIPAFNNVPHDFNLSLNICQGLRPKVIEGTMPEYAELMKRCWNSDPNKRPTVEDLIGYFKNWFNLYFSVPNKRIPVPEDEPAIENHPLSCYISRKIDYSSKLDEILIQGLSSKIIINNEENNCNVESESLEICEISSSKIGNSALI